MEKGNPYFRVRRLAFACVFLLAGCAKEHSEVDKSVLKDAGQALSEEPETEEGSVIVEADTETDIAAEADTEAETGIEDAVSHMEITPEIVEADWSEYFDGLNGEAVVYDASDRRYMLYNREGALARRSPCSTFKIISSLVALENGMITPEDSVRTYPYMEKQVWEKQRGMLWMHGLRDLQKLPKEPFIFVYTLEGRMAGMYPVC